MSPDEVRAFVSQNFAYILFFNFIISAFFGVISLVIGTRRGKRNLGLIGLIVSSIIGIPSWILGLISAAIFVSIILVKTGKGRDGELPQ